MRLSSIILPAAAFILAAALSVLVAVKAANVIEKRSQGAVKTALLLAGDDWAKVDVDGLQVILSGTALSEAQRFHALSAARSVVDAERVIDRIEVADALKIPPPEFSIEILRNSKGISLIGLAPQSTDRTALAGKISKLAGDAEVADMLDTAAYPAPEGWEEALAYGIEALKRLKSTKISIAPGHVSIIATAETPTGKRRLEESLAAAAPDGLALDLSISAPRPVITPFTLRFLIDGKGARFDACAADSPESKERILAAAREAGLDGGANCTIGIGAPSPQWGDAAVSGIRALAALGGGSLTISDRDVSLIAREDASPSQFEAVSGRLEADLPEPFTLHAVLPQPVKLVGTGADTGEGPPEFVATRSPEGLVQLKGRLADERLREAVNSFAYARFGIENVDSATRLDPDLPNGWPVRVLAGLEALSKLNNGAIVIQPDFAQVRGISGNPEARAEISRLLSEKLGAGANFEIDVKYRKRLDPKANLPTPEECAASINAVLKENKITFAPGSATIDPSASKTLDRIAELLKKCEDVKMEIAGHTDSQGREEMNLNLSQARAEAVLTALMARRILTSGLVARGYGETRPIADNKTEEGREANRRIEFTLIQPESEESAENNDAGEGEGAAEAPADGAAENASAQPPADEAHPPEKAPVPAARPAPKPRPETTDEQN